MLASMLWIALGCVTIGFLAIGGGRVLWLWLLEPVGAAVPLLACIIFLAAPQMADMMVALKSGYGARGFNDDVWHQSGLGVSVLFLGLQSWYWTRAALNARRGTRDADTPPNIPWQEIAAPRMVLLPIAAIAVSPVWMALAKELPWSSVPWFGVTSALVAAFILGSAAWGRRRRLRATFGQRHSLAARSLPACRILRLFVAAPKGPYAALALIVLGLCGLLAVLLVPDFINDSLHTPTAALLAMGCYVPLASALLAVLRDGSEIVLNKVQGLLIHAKFPLAATADWIGVGLLVAVPTGGSYIAQWSGLYDVRKVPDSEEAVSGRPSVDAAEAIPSMSSRRT